MWLGFQYTVLNWFESRTYVKASNCNEGSTTPGKPPKSYSSNKMSHWERSEWLFGIVHWCFHNAVTWWAWMKFQNPQKLSQILLFLWPLIDHSVYKLCITPGCLSEYEAEVTKQRQKPSRLTFDQTSETSSQRFWLLCPPAESIRIRTTNTCPPLPRLPWQPPLTPQRLKKTLLRAWK